MTVKVKVKNFQSISDSSITIKGFTCLTGPNNSGKTALVRAIRGVATNPSVDALVRSGEKTCEVQIDFPEEKRSVTWRKGTSSKDKPTYVIDGGKPIHPGREVPDEIRELGFAPIKVGGTDVWPTIASQFTGQIFLLDKSGSVLAEAVADIDRVAHLNKALKASESDRRGTQTKLKIRKEDFSRLESELEKYAGIDQVMVDLQQLAEKESYLARVRRSITKLDEFRTDHRRASFLVKSLQDVQDIQVPSAGNLGNLKKSLEEMISLHEKLDTSSRAIQKYLPIQEVEIPLPERMIQLAKKVSSLRSLQNHISKSHLLISKIQESIGGVEVPDVKNILSVQKELEEKKAILKRLKKSTQMIFALETDMEKSQEELDQVKSEIHGLLDGLDECPTCGTPMGVS